LPVQAWRSDRRCAPSSATSLDGRRRRTVVTNSVRVDATLLDLRVDAKNVLADRVGLHVNDAGNAALDQLVRSEAFLLAANGIEWVALGGHGVDEHFLRLCIPARPGAAVLCMDADPIRRTR
jgi:hypothetical protein